MFFYVSCSRLSLVRLCNRSWPSAVFMAVMKGLAYATLAFYKAGLGLPGNTLRTVSLKDPGNRRCFLIGTDNVLSFYAFDAIIFNLPLAKWQSAIIISNLGPTIVYTYFHRRLIPVNGLKCITLFRCFS